MQPSIPAKKISLIKHSYVKHQANQSQSRVSEIKLKIEQRNCANKAGVISKHLATWQHITSDQWILKTVSGESIEIEDLKDVPLGQSRQNQNNLSDTEKILFRKEVRNQDPGYISPIFLREKKKIINTG